MGVTLKAVFAETTETCGCRKHCICVETCYKGKREATKWDPDNGCEQVGPSQVWQKWKRLGELGGIMEGLVF